MPSQLYAVAQPPIDNVLTWVKSGEIAIPEIQRPFVWTAVQVRNLLDSLFRGYPVGYLIGWRNANVKLKDGTTSAGKRILIDGQQRVIGLMAALLGREIINKDYRRTRIRIAFHPDTKQFEVWNPAIGKDPAWVQDIALVFAPDTSLFDFVKDYCAKNPGTNEDTVFRSLEKLRGLTNNQIGLIELASELDIEVVTEIFVRVNSEGVPLSQADFAMSKIAVNETYGGNTLRKAIDYFCHLTVAPDFINTVNGDREFNQTEYFRSMAWLRDETDDIYDPTYTDVLRVAFTSEFKRGKLEDLVALLSGRNFETRQYEEAVVEDSFGRLKDSTLRFMNETHFKNFIMIIRSAGFVDASLIGSQNTLNFAYILYLTLRAQGFKAADIERYVRRWFVLSALTGRYSGSPESTFDSDIRQIHGQGVGPYLETLVRGELSDAFWDVELPGNFDTSAGSSPYFRVFLAAQVKMNDRGFLSRDISVRELIEVKSDKHHIFPREYLKSQGLKRDQYNQVANYAVTQSEINIAIGKREPKAYMSEVRAQCQGAKKRYGNIETLDDLTDNLRANCIPAGVFDMVCEDYPAFLAERRRLMAQKIKSYFEAI